MGRKKLYTEEEAKERRRQYHREWYANVNPEAKQRLLIKRRQYRSDPETNKVLSDKKKEKRLDPEVRKREIDYGKEYRSRPNAIKQIKEYQSRPEVKERLSQRSKEINKKKREEYVKSEKYLLYIKTKEDNLISKKCNICNVIKLKIFFSKSGVSKETGSIRYKPYCKECSSIVWQIKKSDSYFMDKTRKRESDRRKRTYDKTKEKNKRQAWIDRCGGLEEWRKIGNIKAKEKRAILKDASILLKTGSSCALIESNCIGCKKLFLVRKNGKFKKDKNWCLECIKDGKYKNTFTILPVKVICIDCDNEYIGAKHSKRCVECKGINRQQYRRKINRNSNSISKRVRKYGVLAIPYKSIDVFKRDKWICYVCNKKTIRYPSDGYHENGATIDHIIPLSLGGSDEISNIKTCCHKCNSAKSASVTGNVQLSLFTIIKGATTL